MPHFTLRDIPTISYNTQAILPPVTPPDADLLDWVNRTIGFGSSVSGSTQAAVSTFIASCKSSGVWTKIKRCGIYASDTFVGLQAPLIRISGSSSDTLLRFVTSDYSLHSGLTGHSSTLKWINTGIVPFNLLGLNNNHLSIYVTANNGNNGGIQCGCSDNNTGRMNIAINPTATTFSDGALGDNVNYTETAGVGLYVLNRNVTSGILGYKNGNQVAQIASPDGSGTLPGADASAPPLAIHSWYRSDFSVRDAIFPSPSTLAFYSVGDALTASDNTALYSAVQALQTALSRNV